MEYGKNGNKIEQLNFGDKVYARIEGTEQIEQYIVQDKILPQDFEIEIGEIEENGFKINCLAVDYESGIANYTYIIEKEGIIVKEIKEVLDSSCIVTELTPNTEYKIYVIVSDKAGNKKTSMPIIKSTAKEVTIAVTPSTNQHNECKDLKSEYNITWKVLEKIAKQISNNSSITPTVDEVSIIMGATTYTIGVGDYMFLKYNNEDYKVRILGFNSDILQGYTENEDGTVKTYSNAYGGQNKYAGITFDFQDCIGTIANNTNIYWPESTIYTEGLPSFYNGETGLATSNTEWNSAIKYVRKIYGTKCGYNDIETLNTTNISDKIWLLSCYEVFGVGRTQLYYDYGNTKSKEGITQYRLYAKLIGSYGYGQGIYKAPTWYNNTNIAKYLSQSKETAVAWRLRSNTFYYGQYVCTVRENGIPGEFGMNYGGNIAPGFAI